MQKAQRERQPLLPRSAAQQSPPQSHDSPVNHRHTHTLDTTKEEGSVHPDPPTRIRWLKLGNCGSWHAPHPSLQPNNTLWPSAWTWRGCSSILHLHDTGHDGPPDHGHTIVMNSSQADRRQNTYGYVYPRSNSKVWTRQCVKFLPRLPTVLCCWWQKWQTAGRLSWEKRAASSCGRRRWGTSLVRRGTAGRHHPATAERKWQKRFMIYFFKYLHWVHCPSVLIILQM